MNFGVGQSVARTEDPRFLTGRGTYIDDINLPHMAHAAIVYAQVSNAVITSIDIVEAEAAPAPALRGKRPNHRCPAPLTAQQRQWPAGVYAAGLELSFAFRSAAAKPSLLGG